MIDEVIKLQESVLVKKHVANRSSQDEAFCKKLKKQKLDLLESVTNQRNQLNVASCTLSLLENDGEAVPRSNERRCHRDHVVYQLEVQENQFYPQSVSETQGVT